MEQISREVWLALRGLRARPGTSLLAVVALALGIGLTTAMFCIVDGVFLRGLPFERAERLLYVGEQDTRHAARRPRDMPVSDYLEGAPGNVPSRTSRHSRRAASTSAAMVSRRRNTRRHASNQRPSRF